MDVTLEVEIFTTYFKNPISITKILKIKSLMLMFAFHVKNLKLQKKNNIPEASALAKHILESLHQFDFKNVTIFVSKTDVIKRLVSDMLTLCREYFTISLLF